MIDLVLSSEMRAARESGQPVVALESTIITHGMPYPQNIDVARQVEADIRDAGAVPATIAVLEGHLHIGLDPDQLKTLSTARNVAKLSRADLAACLATGGTGATTVAATMIAAHHAGIALFATGGIGGVHRGAETSFDISADLHELAQTPVTVIAAGLPVARNRSIRAWISSIGAPEPPNPPIITVAPSEMSATASATVGSALSIAGLLRLQRV